MTMPDTPLTDAELAEIAARADAATPGPWKLEGYSGGIAVQPALRHARAVEERMACPIATVHAEYWNEWRGDTFHPGQGYNATFIAHARADIPRLVAEVRRLRSDIRQLRNALLLEAGLPACAVCGEALWPHHRNDTPPLCSAHAQPPAD